MSLLKRFKRLKTLEFKNNYILSLLQIAKLENLSSLKIISIEKEGNPIFDCSLLK